MLSYLKYLYISISIYLHLQKQYQRTTPMYQSLPIWYHLPVDNNHNYFIYRIIAIVFTSFCAYSFYNKLGQKMQHDLLLVALSLNPITVYYFVEQPGMLLQAVLIVTVTVMQYNHKQQRQNLISSLLHTFAISCLILMYPSFAGLLFFLNKGKVLLTLLLCCFLFYLAYFNGDITIILGDEAFQNNFESSQYPSLNIMFLLRAHLFLRYQELYTVFLGLLPILIGYPLSQMPISKLNGVVVVLSMCLYVLPNCNIILILGLLLSFEIFYKQLTDDLISKIAQLKQAKIIFIMRIVFDVVLVVVSVMNWKLIQKWRSTHQLNTGHLTIFQVILWIVPMVLMVQLTEICLQRRVKIIYNIELVQKQADKSILAITKQYLVTKWKQL